MSISRKALIVAVAIAAIVAAVESVRQWNRPPQTVDFVEHREP